MPAVIVYYPRTGFFTPVTKAAFITDVKRIVATCMDAIDPKTEVKTNYAANPDSFIDLVMVPYNQTDAEVTTPLLATIVSYGWPDRMRNIKKRIKRITTEVRATIPAELVPEGDEAISFTFLAKKPGAWYAA